MVVVLLEMVGDHPLKVSHEHSEEHHVFNVTVTRDQLVHEAAIVTDALLQESHTI